MSRPHWIVAVSITILSAADADGGFSRKAIQLITDKDWIGLEALTQPWLLYRPKDPNAYVNRGIAQARLRRPAEAIASLRIALSLEKNYPKGLYVLGVIHSEQGDRSGLIECYDVLRTTSPGQALALLKVASVQAVLVPSTSTVEASAQIGYKPRILTKPEVQIPMPALGADGSASIDVILDTEGRPVMFEGGTGAPPWVQYLLATTIQCRFEPAEYKDRTVFVKTTVTQKWQTVIRHRNLPAGDVKNSLPPPW